MLKNSVIFIWILQNITKIIPKNNAPYFKHFKKINVQYFVKTLMMHNSNVDIFLMARDLEILNLRSCGTGPKERLKKKFGL